MPELSPDQVARALAGDERLVRQLVDTLTPIIQARAARALVRRSGTGRRDVRQEIEDLTQAVFAALFAQDGHALRQWDPARGRLDAFVRVIAEREVISVLRSRNRNPWTEDPTQSESLEMQPAPDVDIEAALGSRELLSTLLERLRARVSDKGHEVFELLVVEGRSVEEVGVLMKMTPEAIYAWRSRLARLAREVAAEVLSEKRSA